MNYTSYITSIFLNCLSKDNHQVLYSQGSSPTQVARFCSSNYYRLFTCFNLSISQGIFHRCSITHLSFLGAKLFKYFLRVEDNHKVLYSKGSSPTQGARFCCTNYYRLLTCFNNPRYFPPLLNYTSILSGGKTISKFSAS